MSTIHTRFVLPLDDAIKQFASVSKAKSNLLNVIEKANAVLVAAVLTPLSSKKEGGEDVWNKGTFFWVKYVMRWCLNRGLPLNDVVMCRNAEEELAAFLWNDAFERATGQIISSPGLLFTEQTLHVGEIAVRVFANQNAMMPEVFAHSVFNWVDKSRPFRQASVVIPPAIGFGNYLIRPFYPNNLEEISSLLRNENLTQNLAWLLKEFASLARLLEDLKQNGVMTFNITAENILFTGNHLKFVLGKGAVAFPTSESDLLWMERLKGFLIEGNLFFSPICPCIVNDEVKDVHLRVSKDFKDFFLKIIEAFKEQYPSHAVKNFNEALDIALKTEVFLFAFVLLNALLSLSPHKDNFDPTTMFQIKDDEIISIDCSAIQPIVKSLINDPDVVRRLTQLIIGMMEMDRNRRTPISEVIIELENLSSLFFK